VKLPVAARWVFVLAVVGAFADIAVGMVSRPLPALSLVAVGVAAVVRHRTLRRGSVTVRAARTAATAGRPRPPA
jgi:hypothetical protein